MPALRSRILALEEVALIVKRQHHKRRYYLNRRNLLIFRLSACCGLRVSELTRLRLCDVHLGPLRPCLELPASICKADSRGRRHGRSVPLWWDSGTLADITAWKAERERQGAHATDPLICTRKGTIVDRVSAGRVFQRLCRCLGRPVTIHDGRHTFISTMLFIGRSLPEVQDAAGHKNVATTGLYVSLMKPRECEIRQVWTT